MSILENALFSNQLPDWPPPHPAANRKNSRMASFKFKVILHAAFSARNKPRGTVGIPSLKLAPDEIQLGCFRNDQKT